MNLTLQLSAMEKISCFQKPKGDAVKIIIAVVVACHLLFLFLMGRSAEYIVQPHVQLRKLVVKTVQLNEKKKVLPKASAQPLPPVSPKVAEKSLPQAEAPAEVIIEEPIAEVVLEKKKIISKPTPKPTPPKTTVKKEIKPSKKVTPKPKETVKPEKAATAIKKETPDPVKKAETTKAEPAKPTVDPKAEAAKARKQQLLANAQASMSKTKKVSKAELNQIALMTVPSGLSDLSIDALPKEPQESMSMREIGYRDELVGRLKLFLKLPEHGEVTIKLTLSRSGKVNKLQIVSSQSAVNKSYIEKTLPDLTFPPFGSNFGDNKEFTFLISLSNDL